MTRTRLRGIFGLILGIVFIVLHFVDAANGGPSMGADVHRDYMYIGVICILFGMFRIARG